MIQPSQFLSTPIPTLLHEAALGRIGFDQRLYDAILARPQEAGPALLAFGLTPAPDSRIELDVDIINLLSRLPETDPLPYLVKILGEGYSELPESLVALVRSVGPRAVEPLIEIFHKLDEEISGEVAFLLASLGHRDDRIAAIIRERLQFDLEDGAMLAGLYGDSSLLPDLEKLLAETGKNRDLEFAIENLKAARPELVEENLDPRGDYPAFALPAFDVLEDKEIKAIAFEHEEEEVRLEALDIVEDLDLSAKDATPLLALAQSDASEALRAAAFRALTRLQQVREVQVAAHAALADQHLSRRVRAAALITLLPKYPLEQWKSLLEEFLADPASRADAVQAMWRSRQPVFASSFGAFLDASEDLEVRRQAIRGAGVMGDKTALTKMRDAFADDDLRKDALFAYAMAVPTDVSASRMRSLLKRIDEEAGSLNPAETTNVQLALDMRLEAAGKAPILFPDEEDDPGHVHGPGCNHVH